MPPQIKKTWTKGLNTRLEKESVPDASDCLNWQFKGDHIELRRGQKRMGSLISVASPATFVKVGKKYDGTQVLFWGYLRKLMYYDEATSDNIEIGTDVLPVAASGEDIAATLYQSFAGSFIYLSSPNSSIYKIAVANPGSVTDQLMDTFRGYIKATLGRMFLWNRKDKFGGSDKTGLYGSSIDKDSLADYPFVSAEDVGTGNGVLTNFTGTLAFKSLAPKKTCHFVRFAAPYASLKTISALTKASSAQITATAHGFVVGDVVVIQDVVGMTQINKRIAVVLTIVDVDNFTVDIDSSAFTAYSSDGKVAKSELFTDSRSGTLSGNQGGTGTINYTTGAFSITFNAAVTNVGEVVSDYYTEDATDADSGVSNSGAVLDFSEGNGSSIADSFYFPQADAGEFMNVGAIGQDNFCVHTQKTYDLRLISTDDITNLIYREKVGIPFFRGLVSTGAGIYYLNNIDPNNPKVSLLELAKFNTEVVPRSVSDQLDLSGYLFDQVEMFEWGEFIIMNCRTPDSSVNNRKFMLNTIWDTWEVHDYRCKGGDDIYNGALVAGDSGAAGVFKLFSGVADQNSKIENFFITGNDDYRKKGVKEIRRMRMLGMIGDDQQIDVSYSADNAPFVLCKSILGSGPYVDKSQRKVIGTETLGEIIGGGQEQQGAIFASPYELEFQINTARFERIRFKFEAVEVGYASIAQYGPTDWRDKGRKLPQKYQE